eukprot:CAMPEP_0172849668 /NCGR_PEP_ID=MMETSP1075-20121228/46578_1 /TAXON_ID=2916 /ORGANISM="Ceratium fusus, Strain PA161109" /LENGTH=63 /DNA_ID=CAMNT_0013695285 /DNA_START=105 /DNA_END=293 /DNA_ORIENTATION=+
MKLDLGGNVWIIARLEGETLIMIKIKYTDKATFTVLEKRKDPKADKACGKQETFAESCFKGDV